MSTWLERTNHLGGRAVYEPIATETRLQIKSWLPIVKAAFTKIEFEPDRGPGEYTPFAERCGMGSHQLLQTLPGDIAKKLREDAYATARHHVMQTLAAILVASKPGDPRFGNLRICQPEGSPPREFMDDTDSEHPTPTVCYFLRWEWTALKQKTLPPPLPKSLPEPKPELDFVKNPPRLRDQTIDI